MENYIKDKLKFKDDKLDIDQLSSYTLNLYLSPYEFAFSVYSSSENRCLRLESFVFPSKLIFGKNEDVLIKIFEDNHLLPAAFWKDIKLYVSGTDYTFVPNELYSESHIEKYMEFNCSITKEKYTNFSQQFEDITLLYSIENEIIDFTKKIYPSREVKISSFLNNVLPVGLSNKNTSEKKVYTFLDQGLITVFAVKSGKFHYCNTSHFKNIDDALYYIMMVYSELNLSAEEVPLEVFGNSDALVLLQSRVFKYVRQVDLGSKPKGLKLSYEFDELEDGRFFGILNAKE